MAYKASVSHPITDRALGVHIPLNEFISEGIRIQHRFKAEPVFAKTGIGFLASSGVEEIEAAKQSQRSHGRRR